LAVNGAPETLFSSVFPVFFPLSPVSNGFIVPLRMDEATLKVGDDAVHGETAYAIGVEGE
jgi:Amt family ammonium transporter